MSTRDRLSVRLQHAYTRTRTHTHTHNQAPSNPSVSESRLSEMKVQSPGTESQPSKNVPFSQTEETCRGGVCFTASPKGLGLSSHRPDPSCKAGIPTCSQRAGSQPTPLPRRKGKGQPWSHPGISGGACLCTHPHPHLRGTTFSHWAVFSFPSSLAKRIKPWLPLPTFLPP